MQSYGLCGFDFVVAPLVRESWRPPAPAVLDNGALPSPLERSDCLYINSSQWANQVRPGQGDGQEGAASGSGTSTRRQLVRLAGPSVRVEPSGCVPGHGWRLNAPCRLLPNTRSCKVRTPPPHLPRIPHLLIPPSQKVVGAVSDWIQPDAANPALRQRSVTALKTQLGWAAHLGLQAVVMPPPHAPGRCPNYAGVLNQVGVGS